METRRRPRRRRQMKNNPVYLLALVLVMLVCLVVFGEGPSENTKPEQTEPVQTEERLESTTVDTEPEATVDTSPEGIKEAFLKTHGLTESDYLDQMFEVYEYFPEVRDFILNYPLKKDSVPEDADISGYDRSQGVPLFIQWDEAWGYAAYGNGVCGISGCGPVSLSMVAYYLTGDTRYTPQYMMTFAKEEGHMNSGGGTNWSLFNKGAVELGFHVEEVPLYENAIRKRLETGNPVVVNVGPGDFTRNGHYMVIVGYEDGMFRINDPFSRINSEKLWSYERIESQIKNLWMISLPEQ